MRKTILILGAGSYYIKSIEKVKSGGYRVLVVDKDKYAPGFRVADGYAAIDITDKENLLQYARKNSIDAVLPINDFGIRSAAFIAEHLNLNGLNIKNAEYALDKGLMRDQWANCGLPMPKYKVIANYEEALFEAERLGYPLVMKPTDCGGGGRGISVIRDKSELRWSFKFCLPFVNNSRLIIEEFVEGTEVTVEALVYQGKVTILAISDKFKPELRTRVATSLNYPAALSSEIKKSICEISEKAILVLGINNGAAHLELIVGKEGPKLIEIGARGGGGHIFSTIVEAVCGVVMPLEAARILAKDKPALKIRWQKGAVYRFFTPKPGIIKAIEGLEEAKKLKGVLDIGIFKNVGDTVNSLENSLERTGFVVTSGKTREEAILNANKVEDTIKFIIG